MVFVMGMWREKQLFFTSQGVKESVNGVLFGITLLRYGDIDASNVEDVRDSFDSGVGLLRELRNCIENPGSATNFHVMLVNHLRESESGTVRDLSTEFETESLEELRETLTQAITVLRGVSDAVEWDEELDDVEQIFRRIGEFAGTVASDSLSKLQKPGDSSFGMRRGFE